VRRYLWILVLVCLAGFFGYRYSEQQHKLIESNRRAAYEEQAIKSQVEEMVRQYHASAQWQNELKVDQNSSFQKVLTIDLERVWMNGSPILFIGAVVDIQSAEPSRYIVTIEPSLNDTTAIDFSTSFRLVLRADASKIDSFLAQHPQVKTDVGSGEGVAVIAHIDSISTESKTESEVENVTKIGAGRLIDLGFVGGVSFD
jgi:hypothetical protein